MGLIVGASHFTALSFFRLEFHGRLKTIDIDPQRAIEFGELSIGEQALEAIIANHLPDNLPVFLLYIALIIAASRTPSGEGDLFLFTKSQQLHIDKLGSVVRVDPQERKREQLLCSLESSDDGRLSPVEERKALGPPGGNIGQR